jgi:hypothetical protein
MTMPNNNSSPLCRQVFVFLWVQDQETEQLKKHPEARQSEAFFWRFDPRYCGLDNPNPAPSARESDNSRM